MALLWAPGAWAGPRYKVLYNFKGGNDGAGPAGGLISDASGNLYGTTATGGVNCSQTGGCGTVFELRRVRNGWEEELLYRFRGNPDGAHPHANLAFDKKGNLYGVTEDGGGEANCSGSGCGVVFELTPSAGAKWKETIAHSFTGGNDGQVPAAGVILDATGNMYGTTLNGGGSMNCTPNGCGTVFELTSQADGNWHETILHSFSATDGASPNGLIFDNAGNLYGLTYIGGTYGAGAAFELSPSFGRGWIESVLYNFEGGSDGAGPGNGLTFRGRNLFGATPNGGDAGWGTIFELKPGSGGGWTHTVLYSFTGVKDGRYPFSPFVFDKSGNLYGTTGGDVSCLHGNRWGCGNVFELKPQSGGQWKLQVLHNFPGGKGDSYPFQVMSDGRNNLYGVAGEGGTGKCQGGGWAGCGVVFELTP